MHRRQLVDERQVDAEGVQGRPRRFREVGAVRERVHVVQVLHPARQRHLDRFARPSRTQSYMIRTKMGLSSDKRWFEGGVFCQSGRWQLRKWDFVRRSCKVGNNFGFRLVGLTSFCILSI